MATSRPLLIPLRDLGDDVSVAGAKAVNLGRLARAGVPVPEGFVVTAGTLREHLATCDAALLVRDTTSRIPEDGAADARSVLRELRWAIGTSHLADDLAADVTSSAAALGPRLAVRSSGTLEDAAGHSFAGQHDTFLDVDPDDCPAKVVGCLASLWTDRAYDYRARLGLDHEGAGMAAIVQRLVPAEAAGVLFTRDPTNGAERVVIEAAPGLGAAVASGTVATDRIVLDGAARRVRERVTAGATPCLDDLSAIRLAHLALEAERVLGTPLDVEWALDRGTLFLLQARPITALPPPRSWADRQVWTNANVGEVLPDVVSPMTLSLIEPVAARLFGTFAAWFGASFEGVSLGGIASGRGYFNLNALIGFIHCVPGMGSQDVGELLGGAHGTAAAAAAAGDIPDDDLPALSLSLLDAAVNAPRLAAALFTHTSGNARRYTDRMRRGTERDWATDGSELDDADLARCVTWRLDRLVDTLDLYIYVGVGVMQTAALFASCKRWFGDDGDAIAGRLLSGLGSLDAAESGLALWRLGRIATAHPAVADSLRAHDRYDDLRRALPGCSGGAAFLEAWEAFSRSHGHHARGEIELFNPRWSEAQDELIPILRAVSDATGAEDPVARAGRLAREREALLASCRRRLGNPITRALFTVIARRAQRALPIRENIKSETVRRLARTRATLLTVGERLVRHGVLTRSDDVFFLRHDEVAAPLLGDRDPRLPGVVRERREQHDRDAVTVPPPVIIGRHDVRAVAVAPPHPGDVMHGLAVSPGVVRGPARVILRAATDHVRPGEILVAPFTDPGWTPYFLNAAGIVMDLGGLLSHGSIIAREYGIPCVVNVGAATTAIENGQTIEVDGDRGTVTIVSMEVA